jgi:hypothetical protein
MSKSLSHRITHLIHKEKRNILLSNVVSRANIFFFSDRRNEQKLFFSEIHDKIMDKKIFNENEIEMKRDRNLIIITKGNFIIIIRMLHLNRSVAFSEVERLAGYMKGIKKKKSQKLYGIICSNKRLSDRANDKICKYKNILFSHDCNIIKRLVEIKNIICK